MMTGQNPNEPRYSFERTFTDEELTPNKGLKLQPKELPVKPAEQQKIFEEAALDVQEQRNAALQEALELGQKFLVLLADKTLVKNKGPIQSSIEKEVLGNWHAFIVRINNNKLLFEGEGSSGAFSLLFPSILKLRDRLNTAEYNTNLLNEELLKVKTELAELKKSSE